MFLKRGGRVSGAVAVAGTLLGIKPVLHVDDEGHLIAMEKVRGRRASLDALVRHFEQTALDKTGGTVFISHGDCAEDCRYVIDKLKALGVKDIRWAILARSSARTAAPAPWRCSGWAASGKRARKKIIFIKIYIYTAFMHCALAYGARLV